MERLVLDQLLNWKQSPYRKPLILKGVRQVGKTWILKEFGKRFYENTTYFNFDENEEYKQFFETTKNVDRILSNLMMASGQKIEPQKTLIIFDEIQDCPKALNSLKYFCENAPEYHIACAGSLLGSTLAKFKGALTENFVLQTLVTQFEVVPRYWTQTNPPYEVDFLIQKENDIFPVEVKSEANTTSKSLKKIKELFPDQVKLRVRFSLNNLKLDDDVLNIPLFIADQTDRLIGLALKEKNIRKN